MIEKMFPFKVNELIIKDEEASAKIIDAELDVFDCTFGGAEDITIRTKGYDYITLTLENIKVIKKLITEAEKYYDKKYADTK